MIGSDILDRKSEKTSLKKWYLNMDTGKKKTKTANETCHRCRGIRTAGETL